MRDAGGSTSAGTDWTAPNPGGDTVSGASAGSSHVVITCLVCEEKIPTWRDDVRVECQCGAEYHAPGGQLVEGLAFHRYYFDLGGIRGRHQTTMCAPRVRH